MRLGSAYSSTPAIFPGKLRPVFLEISAEVEGQAYLISHGTARSPQGKAEL